MCGPKKTCPDVGYGLGNVPFAIFNLPVEMNRDELQAYAAENNFPDSWFYLLKGEVSPEPLPADRIPDFAELVTNVQATETEGDDREWHSFVANRPALKPNEAQPEEKHSAPPDPEPSDSPKPSKSETEPLRKEPVVDQEDKYRKCPFCAEKIKAEAVKCRFCGSSLTEDRSQVPSGPVCPNCRGAMVTFQKKASFSAAGVLGVLLFIIGLFVMIGHLIGGLLFIIIGLLISFAGRPTLNVMKCTNCGTEKAL